MNKIMSICMTLVVFSVVGCSRAKLPEKSVEEAAKEVLEKAMPKIIGEAQKAAKEEGEKAKKAQEEAAKLQESLKNSKVEIKKEIAFELLEPFKKEQEAAKKTQEETKKMQDALKETFEKTRELFKKSQEDILKRLEVLEKAKEKPPVKIEAPKEPKPKNEVSKEKTMSAFEKQSQSSMYVQRQRSAYELQLAHLESNLLLLNSRIRFFQEAEDGFRFDQKIEKLVKENNALKESIDYWQGKYGSILMHDVDTEILTKKEDDIKNRIASLDQQMKTLSVGDDLRAFQHRFLQLQAAKRDMIDALEQARAKTIKAQSIPVEGSVFSSTTIQGFMKDVQKMKALLVRNKEKIAKLKSEKKNGGKNPAHSMEIARLQQIRRNYLLVIGEIRSSLGMPESPMAISRP